MPEIKKTLSAISIILLLVSGCTEEMDPGDNQTGVNLIMISPLDNASDLLPGEVEFRWTHPGGNDISFDLLLSKDMGNTWKLIPVGYENSYKPGMGEIEGSSTYLWQVIIRKGNSYMRGPRYKFSTVRQFFTNDYEIYISNGENKVNLVILGDGFMKEDLVDNGAYQIMAQNLIDYIFSVEPYKSYKSYFNAYIHYAESKDHGILRGDGPAIGTATRPPDSVSTYFESSYDSYGLNTLRDKCYEAAELIPGVNSDQAMICLVINDTKYGGMTWLSTSGRAIPICPMSDREEPFSFYNLVMHETGHAFSKLADEYGGKSVPPEDKVLNDILAWQDIGWFRNISVTDDPENVPWKHFLNSEEYLGSDYSPVGIYEGGYSYWYGIFRPEQENCMRGAMIPYYDVASREIIVKRILSIVGEEYSFEKFLANDRIVPADEIESLLSRQSSGSSKMTLPHYCPKIINN